LSRVTGTNIKCGRACSPETAGRISQALALNLSELVEDQQ